MNRFVMWNRVRVVGRVKDGRGGVLSSSSKEIGTEGTTYVPTSPSSVNATFTSTSSSLLFLPFSSSAPFVPLSLFVPDTDPTLSLPLLPPWSDPLGGWSVGERKWGSRIVRIQLQDTTIPCRLREDL